MNDRQRYRERIQRPGADACDTSAKRLTENLRRRDLRLRRLEKCNTGDTECDENSRSFRVDDFPTPVISVAIEPKSKAGPRIKRASSLQRLAQEDPTSAFYRTRYRPNLDLRKWVNSPGNHRRTECREDNGKQSRSHQVAYRETIRKKASPKAAHQAGPDGIRANRTLQIELTPDAQLQP